VSAQNVASHESNGVVGSPLAERFNQTLVLDSEFFDRTVLLRGEADR